MQIESINISINKAITTKGKIVPIVAYIDGDGELCEENAIIAVCGNSLIGFVNVVISDYEDIKLN